MNHSSNDRFPLIQFLIVLILTSFFQGCSSSPTTPDFNNPGSMPVNPYVENYTRNHQPGSQTSSSDDYENYYSDPDSFPPTRFDR